MERIPRQRHDLLSSILNDRQWEDCPTIHAPSVHGTRPPTWRPSKQLFITKEKNDKLQLWLDASDVLKCAVTKSLGESVCDTITTKTSRFQQITVAEIIKRVRARFGKLQKDTKTAIKLRMTNMLKTVEELDKHIAALTKLFTISETAGSIVDEHHKVDYFRDSLFGHPLLADILKQFDFEYPDCTTITYAQITAYVVLHLPNLKTAQQSSIRVQANIATLGAYAALQQETKKLRDDVQTLMWKRSSDNFNPNNKNKNKNRTPQTPTRDLHALEINPLRGLNES
jgi:hypothetical protein